jgi:hypothetical protein
LYNANDKEGARRQKFA